MQQNLLWNITITILELKVILFHQNSLTMQGMNNLFHNQAHEGKTFGNDKVMNMYGNSKQYTSASE